MPKECFKGNGKSIRLKRDGPPKQKVTPISKTSPAKFEGTYNAYGDGKDVGFGKATIKAIENGFIQFHLERN